MYGRTARQKKKPMMYCLEYKEICAMPNILGGHSMPVYTFRWKQLALSEDKKALQKIIDNSPGYKDRYRIVEMPQWE